MRKNDIIINDLIKIENNILNIYDLLMLDEYNKDITQYKKHTNYLNLAIELEDKLIDDLNLTLQTNALIYDRITYLIEEKNYEPETKDFIIDRIGSIIQKNFFDNPLINDYRINSAVEYYKDLDEITYDNDTYNTENYIEYDNLYNEISEDFNLSCVEFEYTNEIVEKYIKNINKKINNTTDDYEKQILINEKYDQIYLNKSMECIMLGKQKENIYKRKRCKLYGQDKQFVNKTYLKCINEEIKPLFITIINITDDLLNKSKDHNIVLLLETMKLEIITEMLSEQEFNSLCSSFYGGMLEYKDFYSKAELYSSKSLNEIKKILPKKDNKTLKKEIK